MKLQTNETTSAARISPKYPPTHSDPTASTPVQTTKRELSAVPVGFTLIVEPSCLPTSEVMIQHGHVRIQWQNPFAPDSAESPERHSDTTMSVGPRDRKPSRRGVHGRIALARRTDNLHEHLVQSILVLQLMMDRSSNLYLLLLPQRLKWLSVLPRVLGRQAFITL